MNFIPDAEESRYRDAVRELEDGYGWHEMQEIRREIAELDIERWSFSFLRALREAGLMGSYWPPPFGDGATVMQALLFREQLETDGFPGYGVVQNEGAAGPFLKYGTPEQIAEHLPKIKSGEWSYSGGLSEPEAGSDLLALRTSAVRDGDEYVINGSKLWTSGAHVANWIKTIVRTDPTQTRQRGLTLLLVPTDAPGLEIRPVHVMGGWRVNEVFFDDVRVPVTNRLGEEDNAWRQMGDALDAERAMSFGGNEARGLLARIVHRLSEDATELDEGALQELGRLVTECEADRLLYIRLGAQVQRGERITGTAPMSKVNGSELAQRLAQWAADLLGPETLFPSAQGEPADDPLMADVEEALRAWTVLTVIGGTSEVQRNMIATQALGLPKGF